MFLSGMEADCMCGRFNWAVRKLHKRLVQLGAVGVYPRGEADEQHAEGSVFLSLFLFLYLGLWVLVVLTFIFFLVCCIIISSFPMTWSLSLL